MPRKSKTQSTATISNQQIETTNQSPKITKKLFMLLFFIGIVSFVWKNKSWFIVATVNGKPISRSQLNHVLANRYGNSTLDGLVDQSLIEAELKKQKVDISEDQIKDKLKEIEKSLPQGTTLDQAMQTQGLTLNEVKTDLKLQLGVQKLLESKIEISDTEITEFMKTNGKFLTSTTEAEQKEEALKSIKSTKLYEAISSWITDLRQKASIKRFL